jgi:CBS domain-containing protein
MDTYNVGRLPVMKKEREEGKVSEELVGIISRSDIIREHCRRWSRIKGASS